MAQNPAGHPSLPGVLTRIVAPSLLALVAVCFFAGSARAQAVNITDIPGPAGSETFGANVTILPNGNFVVVDPNYDAPGAENAGAVHLYDGDTLELISTLTSNYPGLVGFGGITVLSNSNFVVSSPYWIDNRGTTEIGDDIEQAGAATWVDGELGLDGVVSAANSLIGSHTSDQISYGGITALTNGNYVVNSWLWNQSPGALGAVTWGNGETGTTGVVSGANSLVGSTSGDNIGRDGVIALRNGNFVVVSTNWQDPDQNAGAVTWGDGDEPLVGQVSAANSLVGSTNQDKVGSGGLVLLPSNNFLVRSPLWDGVFQDEGAVTWVDGESGLAGEIDASNSLIGAQFSAKVGEADVTILTNGNFVVWTPNFGSGGDIGAVTWGNGETGVTGEVGPANSLAGDSTGDMMGSGGIVALSNGNYVVVSPLWDNVLGAVGSKIDVGAVTWGNGESGIVGGANELNSLIGKSDNDQVGSGGIVELSNGNYVVISTLWDYPTVGTDVGAVTWRSGTAAAAGIVSESNSLVGLSNEDWVGSGGVVPLTNGNYVVVSPSWDSLSPSAADAGAVTWANGTNGQPFGDIDWANSLGSTKAGDKIGTDFTGQTTVDALPNGNYVVRSAMFDAGGFPVGDIVSNAGAVSWGAGDGAPLLSGAITGANSLIGSNVGDNVGYFRITVLENGNFVIPNPLWNNGAAADAGAVTWVDGDVGIHGLISSTNSLVGSTTGDFVGGGVVALTNGNYVVMSPVWDNGATVNAGAATFGNGESGIIGDVSTSNSLYGTTASDRVSIAAATALPDGNYFVHSPWWNNGAALEAGAITWSDGTNGMSGAVSSSNSVVGESEKDRLGVFWDDVNPPTIHVAALPNSEYIVLSPMHDGSDTDTGTITLGRRGGATSGVVSNANSVLGSVASGGSAITWKNNPARQWVAVSGHANNLVTIIFYAQELTVAKAGTGSGEVTSTLDAIDCGITCTAEIRTGEVVTLTAVADVSSTFAGWSGDCSGVGACSVEMSQTRAVTATFAIKTYALTVNTAGTGLGTVSGAPANPIVHGTVVTLTAAAATGSTFTGWSGDCSGTGACVVTMTQARSVTATFTLNVVTPNSYALTIIEAGDGAGTVSGAPANPIAEGTVVTLTATAGAGSTFVGWSGDCTGTGACVVTMTQARTVTATFGVAVDFHVLTVNTVGAGTVGGAPANPIAEGTVVTLTATADSGSTFGGWSGDCTGAGQCSVTMDADKSVTATFLLDGAGIDVDITSTNEGGTVTVEVVTDTVAAGAPVRVSSTLETYPAGTVLRLTADPYFGYVFSGWGGDATGTQNPLEVTVTEVISITAAFAVGDVYLPAIGNK